MFFHTGRALASAPVSGGVSYHDPADAVAMVSRESAVPVDREGERPRHHRRLEGGLLIDLRHHAQDGKLKYCCVESRINVGNLT